MIIKSFKYAISGIVHAVKHERNVRIHFLLLSVAVALGFYYEISEMEWIVQLLLFAMVVGSELFNTAIERLTDGQYPDYHENAKVIKDVAAGAVLFISIIAFVIGLIIYLPKILQL